MNNEKSYTITREKHLDHMVRVVPFIVVGYAIQSYVILNMGPDEFAQISLCILGCVLAVMIASFIWYDLKHSVILLDDHLVISFLGQKKKVFYHEITSVEVRDPGHSFSDITLKTNDKRHRIYFVDEAEKVQKLIEEKKTPLSFAA